MKCDVDIRKDLYGNIALSGGITVFTDVGERMSKELTARTPSTMKTKVVAPSERNALRGSAPPILSSLSTFHLMWTSKPKMMSQARQGQARHRMR